MPTPPRCCCSTTRAISWSPPRPAVWRRKSTRASGSRSAGASPAASPQNGGRSSSRVDHGMVLNPLLLDRGIRSLVGVPLLVHDGAVLGVLHAGTVRDRVFTADDAVLLELAADRAAMALQSLRAREDHASALALQRSLVALGAARAGRSGSGRQVRARLRPCRRRLVRRVCLAVGKAGPRRGRRRRFRAGRRGHHGPHPQRPARVRAEFPDPADVLEKLDRKMRYFEEHSIMATVCYAVLDRDSGQLAISSAGHLPPVIAVPGQRAELAKITPDLPIGVARHRSAVRSQRCRGCPAPWCACTPTGWWNDGASTSTTASPACAMR